jgi:hypothetical protein
MFRLWIPVPFFLIFLTISSPSFAAPYAPPGKEDRCPVCGMFVAPYPNWSSSIHFQDGTRVFFDGPKDLFRYFFDMTQYRAGASPAEVAAV